MGRCYRARRRKKSVAVTRNESQDETVIALMKWLKAHGWREETPLRLSSFPLTSRGLMCRENVGASQVMISIPLGLLITRGKALSALCSVKIADQPSKFKLLSSQELLSLFLLTEKVKGRNSFWFPYLETLPKAYSTPYFATTNELEIYPDYLRAKCEAQIQLCEQKFRSIQLAGFPYTKEAFAWAWFTVNTRAVYFETSTGNADDDLALAPLLDMFNHSGMTSVRTGVDLLKNETSPSYQIVTDIAIEKNHEAFISYGPHNGLKLFIEYGFVIPDNIQESVPLTFDRLASVSKCSNLEKEKKGILEKANLLANMMVTSSGLSWNSLACLYVLNLPEKNLSSWHSVYQANLEIEIATKIQLQVLTTLLCDITLSRNQLQSLHHVTDSSRVALQLLEIHMQTVLHAIQSVE